MDGGGNNGLKTAGRGQGGRFAPRNAGRPHGARHKTTMAIQMLLDGDAERLTRKAVELALAGDVTALRMCMDRVAPVRKDAPIAFALPAMTCARDAAQAASAVLGAVSEGELTPAEGAHVMALVETWRRTFETTELEARLTALEGAAT